MTTTDITKELRISATIDAMSGDTYAIDVIELRDDIMRLPHDAVKVKLLDKLVQKMMEISPNAF